MPPQGMPNVALASASQPQSRALQSYLQGKPFLSRWNAYYSRVRATCSSGSTSGSGAAYVLAAGPELIAFGYARGTDMGPAGAAGTLATYCDTNIQTPSQTVAGEAIEVDGVGIIVLGQTDANLLKQADQNVSVKIRMNGNTDYPMGIPSMIPSPGGLFGAADAPSVAPSQIQQAQIQIGNVSNGVPHITNYYPLPEPMIWSSAGHADSTLNVIFKIERTTTTRAGYSAATRAAQAGGAGTPGTAPYAPPDFGTVFIDWMVVVVGRTVLPESDN